MERCANLPHSSRAWIDTHFSLQEVEEGMGLLGKNTKTKPNKQQAKPTNETDETKKSTKTVESTFSR